MLNVPACDGIQQFSSRDQSWVPPVFAGIAERNVCYVSESASQSTAWRRSPALVERCLRLVHALGGKWRGGVAGTFSYLLGALTCVNLNEFPMQPDSYSNLCGFQCNSSSELSNVAIRFPCFGDSGLI